MSILPYFLILLNSVLLLTGQILWKMRLSSIDEWNIDVILALFKSPYILLGFLTFMIATGVWFYVLSKLPLGVAYPLQSIVYVLSLLVSFFIFKEPIYLSQWIGALMIMIGIFLIVR